MDGTITTSGTPAAAVSRSRTRRPREQREREIVEAARDVFSQRGYASASVAEIAQRVGIVEGAIYKYFPSKRDLLVRVLEEFYHDLIASVRVGVTHITRSEDKLRYIIAKHIETLVADRGLCRLVLREIRQDQELYSNPLLALNRRYTSIALQAIEEGIRSGEFSPNVMPTLIRDMIYGSIEHAAWRIVFSDANIDTDLVSRQLADTLLHGIVVNVEQQGEPVLQRLESVVARLEATTKR